MAKIIKPLTDTQVRNAKPQQSNYKLSDGSGMYLLVTKDGYKYWRLDYRHDEKRKTLALGKYPEINLAEARKRRLDARTLLHKGVDPAENKKAQKISAKNSATNSFETIAREWHERHKSIVTENTSKQILNRLQNNIFPWIGKKNIADLTAMEYLAAFKRMEERGILETAHRMKSVCSNIHNYAVSTGRAPFNPIPALKSALKPFKTQHRAAITEPSQLSELLRMIDSYSGSFIVECALKMNYYLFVRPGELRHAEWKNIDFEKKEWRYTITKTQTEHIVPLANQVIEILTALQPLTGHGRYLFPSTKGSDRPISENTLNGALRRLGIEKEEMTSHGWRAVARTLLDEELGERVDFIEHQLGHAVKDANGRAYNRTSFLRERHRMMQSYADYLDNLKAGAKILPFRKTSA